jgi:hypothetical protein
VPQVAAQEPGAAAGLRGRGQAPAPGCSSPREPGAWVGFFGGGGGTAAGGAVSARASEALACACVPVHSADDWTHVRCAHCHHRPHCQAPASPTPGHISIMPLLGTGGGGSSAGGSAQRSPTTGATIDYLPLLPGVQHYVAATTPAAGEAGSAAGSNPCSSPTQQLSVVPDASRAHSLSHACFEVWIAMELCDGGTLAGQLQRGFHCFQGSHRVDMVRVCLPAWGCLRACVLAGCCLHVGTGCQAQQAAPAPSLGTPRLLSTCHRLRGNPPTCTAGGAAAHRAGHRARAVLHAQPGRVPRRPEG